MGIQIYSCLAAPSWAVLPGSRLAINSRRSTFLRFLSGLRRVRLVSRCAADNQPCEPCPEEDPRVVHFRRERERIDELSKKYGAELGSCTQEYQVEELELTLFYEESIKIQNYMEKIVGNKCILYKEAGKPVATKVCATVLMAIHLCRIIVANACLRVDGSSEISYHTIEQIIRAYLSTFVKFVEDVWNRKVESNSRILSIFGALSGLAAVSHIMFEDALVAVNTFERNSSNYIPEYDVEALNHKLQLKMEDLERTFMAASKRSETKAYNELLLRALTSAIGLVSPFVMQTIQLRKKAIAHARGRANEHDASTEMDHESPS